MNSSQVLPKVSCKHAAHQHSLPFGAAMPHGTVRVWLFLANLQFHVVPWQVHTEHLMLMQA